jgi:hypothetical protein
VSTRNFFAGGTMMMASPVDLGVAFGDKNNLLRIMVRIADTSVTLGGGPGLSTGGRPPGNSAGKGDPGGSGEQGGGAGAPGGPGGPGGAGNAGATPEIDPIRNIRMIFGTSDGRKSEVFLPISTSRPDAKGWISVAVPLQAIAGLGVTNKAISEVGFTADSVGTFYVGDVRVINDATPIQGDVNHKELNLALNDTVEFRARGFGGSSVLKYMWDFDDTDGVQIDAEGAVLKRKFRSPGTFNVTLTIGDAYGLKTPYTTKIKIKVNP